MSHFLIADDLSGALEAGAAFRAQGWRVMLPLAGDGGAPAPGLLRLVTTESRNLGPQAAAATVQRALAEGSVRGARLLCKKIDSTLRGPIGAELAAVVETLAPRLVIFCPANPAAGRTVRHGVLRVFGVPLTGTDFRHDPHWPATESKVANLLAAQGVAVTGHIKLPDLRKNAGAAIDYLLAGKTSAVITVDAETTADLELMVRAAHDRRPDVLFVGSGALAAVVAAQMAPPSRSAPPLPRLSSLAILCGTSHPVSQRQLEHAAGAAQVGIITHRVGADSVSASVGAMEKLWKKRPVAAIRFTVAAGGGGAEAARGVLAAATAAAREIQQRLSPEAFFLTGGETAWAVCHALGGDLLEVLAELETGVVVSALRRPNAPSIITITKPGGFGDEGTITRILKG